MPESPGKFCVCDLTEPGAAIRARQDQVTRSAHCRLGPYWQRQLSRSVLEGRQLAPRGGLVHVQVRADRVRYLGDKAAVSARGMLSSEILALRRSE